MSGVRSAKRMVAIGYASYVGLLDKRKQRRMHRKTARGLINGGTLFHNRAPVGSTPWVVAKWHRNQARYVGR